MKILIKIVAVFASILLITSCSTNSSTTVYSYSPPTSVDGRACVDECQQSKSICTEQCTVPDANCLAHEKAKAGEDFKAYAEEQTASGQPVSQDFTTFYHPERCDHTGCGCETNYKVCYQLCGTRTEIRDPLATQ